MSLLQTDQPLYLSKGSVRSVLALSLVGAFIAGLIEDKELVTLALGFYFGERSGASS